MGSSYFYNDKCFVLCAHLKIIYAVYLFGIENWMQIRYSSIVLVYCLYKKFVLPREASNMETNSSVLHTISSGGYDTIFTRLYRADALEQQRTRYTRLVNTFAQVFPDGQTPRLFSAPGRTEISGNHTDHQRGCVVAASIHLDMIAVAAKNDCNCVRIRSEGFAFQQIDLSDLSIHPEEINTTAALIRGTAAIFREKGFAIGGADICVSSNVLRGSGLSSSAAFEVLIGTIFSCLYNDGALDPVLIAQIGQLAENRYFGKPCGLMDQMACSVGGFVSIDFYNPDRPMVNKTNFDPAAYGYSLYIVDVKGDHSDLTDEYAAIPTEMKAVAAFFEKEVLRQVPAEQFYQHLAQVREQTSDRAVLRAHHFFTENLRAQQAAHALQEGDMDGFLRLCQQSGRSSFMYLQNIYPSFSPLSQPASVALMAAEHLLEGRGACRIHGGGFGGTIQAFVPNDMATHFAAEMEKITGKDSCHLLTIRPCGGIEITEEA